MLSRRNRERPSRVWMHVGIGTVCVVLFFFGDRVTGARLSGALRSALVPVIGALHSMGGGSVDTLTDYFASKQRLEAENALLRQRLGDLERAAPADRLAAYALTSRDALAETLAHFEGGVYADKHAVVADVLSYAQLPFGTLSIYFREAPLHTDPGQVRYVFADTGSVLGVLDSLSGKAAVVRLFSRANEEHQMRIGEHELALVRGRGGVTMEAVVPKAAVIHNGDPVSFPEAGNALVGTVGEVTSVDTDTTQRVLIRLLVVPGDVRSVFMFE